MGDREFWLEIRRALLMLVDAIERKCAIAPTTAEVRKLLKAHLRT